MEVEISFWDSLIIGHGLMFGAMAAKSVIDIVADIIGWIAERVERDLKEKK